jgi:hypothetical protein
LYPVHCRQIENVRRAFLGLREITERLQKESRVKYMNESRLVYEIMRELGKFGAVYRCNSGSVKLPNGKRFNGMPKGFSDVMFIRPDGVACFVECKTDRGKPTEDQKRFIARMQRLHAKAGVARSIEEAMDICGLHAGVWT